MEWTELDLTGLVWTELDWISLAWTKMCWADLNLTCQGCACSRVVLTLVFGAGSRVGLECCFFFPELD